MVLFLSLYEYRQPYQVLPGAPGWLFTSPFQ
jgi:hypothetical protein